MVKLKQLVPTTNADVRTNELSVCLSLNSTTGAFFLTGVHFLTWEKGRGMRRESVLTRFGRESIP